MAQASRCKDGNCRLQPITIVPAGDDVTYLATASTICEVNVHKPSYTSWFVGDSVVEGTP